MVLLGFIGVDSGSWKVNMDPVLVCFNYFKEI